MSFSKAKIQRFNDIKDCTPSPARYNVATQEKLKLGGKSGLYLKKTSPHESETQSTEVVSVHSTPCTFQTPLPLKRKKLLGMSFRNPKSESKLSTREELRDKIVECQNKDFYIKDLTDQLEDLRTKLSETSKDNERMLSEKVECENALLVLQQKTKEDNERRSKQLNLLNGNFNSMNKELQEIRRLYSDLKNENLADLSKFLTYVNQFKILYDDAVTESRSILDNKDLELRENVKKIKQQAEEIDSLKSQCCQRQIEIDWLKSQHKEELQLFEIKCKELSDDVDKLKTKYSKEKDELLKELKDSRDKIDLLEENFKDVKVLTEIQMKEKIEELEAEWKRKLQEKEKESEAILKECQEISEYQIIQCEVEKNKFKKLFEGNEEVFKEVASHKEELMNEISVLKSEKHAYELSLTTFKDTIEVLKKRLMESDRDVIQLKEELERNEEKILSYEKKCSEMASQMSEMQQSKEELEMQYESTSKIIQNQVQDLESDLLDKVSVLEKKLREVGVDKKLLDEVLGHALEQNILIRQAHEIVAQSDSVISVLEKRQDELEAELKTCKLKLEEETEEAANIRKKYIEKSGKYDELAQQFEQILQELDAAKSRIQELESLVGPYQEQLQAYQNEMKLLGKEKTEIFNEAKELAEKYADVIGHQNHNQKIKHLNDLKIKSSELFSKNLELQTKNGKLVKMVEKLRKEVDDLRKIGKKVIVGCEKENLASPKLVKASQSPGPLKERN